MIPRKPRIDVEHAPIIWSNPPELAQHFNGISMTAPHIEPYLNRVMQQAKSELRGVNPQLDKLIDLFVMQETNHYTLHRRFNKRMIAAGYSELVAIEQVFNDDLKRLLNEKSLAFNAAYCAGFENLSMYTAKYAFERCLEVFAACDARGADVFLWHMAEEFEHRSVAHDVFAETSGNYFIRIYGLVYSFWHFTGFCKRFVDATMRHYRANMTSEERRASIKRHKRLNRRMLFYTCPRMLAILIPYYKPAWFQPTPAIEAALRTYANQ